MEISRKKNLKNIVEENVEGNEHGINGESVEVMDRGFEELRKG
jgi:hypothetical protein